MKTAEEIYVEVCKLPQGEQKIFLDWAKEYITKLDKKLKRQKLRKEQKRDSHE